MKDGQTTDKLFGFLTCVPNALVGVVHPRAMPVILTQMSEVERWLTAPRDEALVLQRPVPEGVLRVVEGGT